MYPQKLDYRVIVLLAFKILWGGGAQRILNATPQRILNVNNTITLEFNFAVYNLSKFQNYNPIHMSFPKLRFS